MNKRFQVAGHCFEVSGERLCGAVGSLEGFDVFLDECDDVLFAFVEGGDAPEMKRALYDFSYEDVTGVFGRTEDGYMLSLRPLGKEIQNLWHSEKDNVVHINGNLSFELLRYALWVGLGLMVAPCDTVAVHGSCIVYDGKAVIFLGESGTGKSTHTRLWQENINGAFLLNDDSPILRFEDGKVWAYGSPWSGKTPCYRQERYELKACVRLSQAPENQITSLPLLQAYASLHPSCPPVFAYDDHLYDHISSFLGKLLDVVPVYSLGCLPDKSACELAVNTLFVA